VSEDKRVCSFAATGSATSLKKKNLELDLRCLSRLCCAAFEGPRYRLISLPVSSHAHGLVTFFRWLAWQLTGAGLHWHSKRTFLRIADNPLGVERAPRANQQLFASMDYSRKPRLMQTNSIHNGRKRAETKTVATANGPRFCFAASECQLAMLALQGSCAKGIASRLSNIQAANGTTGHLTISMSGNFQDLS
jgi:hypothetical protein